MKAKASSKPRRPRLTRQVIEGLGSVMADAEVSLDERVGCGQATEDDVEYLGIGYLYALIGWYQATHPEGQR